MGARMGKIDKRNNSERNPSDVAFAKLFAAAKKSIMISSQDFGPMRLPLDVAYSWPYELIDGLLWAMSRNVDVYIVLSQPGSGRTEEKYSNGWSATDVIEAFLQQRNVRGWFGLTDDMLCLRFH